MAQLPRPAGDWDQTRDQRRELGDRGRETGDRLVVRLQEAQKRQCQVQNMRCEIGPISRILPPLTININYQLDLIRGR